MHIISMNNQLPSSNILVTLGSKQTFINFFFFCLKEQAFECGWIIWTLQQEKNLEVMLQEVIGMLKWIVSLLQP